ncbi:TPA: hypothetical protein N3O12_000752 [Klebsiella pneumoniae]|nr:hypothetical protein [Klebsiella pneumoniae]EKX4889179.1 hypothetical protein [Raoultella ornithinolytica]MBC4638930.1 hypothetical protein [Klebsiella quasipneumoniae]QLS22925.1 hypothetical protein HV324_18625 [Klebsiella michiganensis]HCI6178106.1 hypothetical protein [Klebsiella quasipneumoniae subsp. quasipneumoniae]HDS9342520.1 hypothetical protein [Klebsiella pneumoniae subsp. pneumoniae]
MKISSIILGSLLLSGCAPSSVAPKVSSQEYITPSVGTTNTAYMGDPMVKSATGYKTELLKLGSASGALSDIKEGTYCHTGNNVYVNAIDKNSVGLKNLYGVVVNSVNYITYDKAKNTISPPNGTSYNSNEISIQYVQNGLCMVSNSLVKTIEYNGKSSNTLKFTYREFSHDMARPAYTTDFTVDLSDGTQTVAYKGAKLKINKADNSSINYTIINGFDSVNNF